jgi:hypothetical protein
LVIIFFLGISIMAISPLLRRANLASPALAGGALAVLLVALVGLVHVDPRIGLAAIESNRREYLFFLACEMPVFMLALISWKGFKWAFWLGYGINAAFTVFVMAVIVWLEFFWHW